MSFFSSKKAPIQYRLIVDIEPNSIGVGLTLVGSTNIEFIDRQFVAYDKKPTMRQMQSKLTALLKDMMQTKILPYVGEGKVVSGLCIHSSAWCIAETHTVDLHFEKPVRVSEKVIIASLNNHRAGREEHAKINDLELVYHHIQNVRLNGYPTNDPWEKVAQAVSCDFIEGYIDGSMKKLCDGVLMRYVPSLAHVPEGFVIISAARQIEPDAENILIVHIGGETTEVIFGDRHHLRRSASAPLGISGIIRDTAEAAHGDNSLAFSHINMAVMGTRIPTKKEQSAIGESIEAWRNAFIKAVHAICGQNVPEHILFFSALHDTDIAEYMLKDEKISAWSGKKHQIINVFGKKGFQHDFMIAAGASYIVE